jgi:hypothetical protein
MVKLSECILDVILDTYDQNEVLTRLANPYWFQALSCVLGYDWHSSGTTTVTCAALKSALNPVKHGLAVVGGKSKFSRGTSHELATLGKVFKWSDEQILELQYASSMSAKVDNTAIQSGYPLYHHALFTDLEGRWSVIQQGMNSHDRTARRYHWLSDHVQSYVDEPHDAIVGDIVKNRVLDMTARMSEGNRKASVDLVNEGPDRIKRSVAAIRPKYQATLQHWVPGEVESNTASWDSFSMPRRVNWQALKRAYELHPRNYEELLGVKGIGPSTVRGLALVSAIIYGEPPSWRDPVQYSFAYGGKDGVPFPVDRNAMDRSVQYLRDALDRAKVGHRERLTALRRLQRFVHAAQTG